MRSIFWVSGGAAVPKFAIPKTYWSEQLTEFLETVPETPTAVIANGLSAAYAIRIAAERPELVGKLVLISPTGYERLAGVGPGVRA